MCMGSSMLPICGICAVKNGKIIPSAKNSAANTILYVFLLLLLILLSSVIK